jgi:PAS domain S-box-containing protein
MMAGTLLTTALFWEARQSELNNFRLQFERDAAMRCNLIARKMEECLVVIKALQRFFAASQHVDGKEFATFTIPFLEEQRELQALEWIPQVTPAERTRYEDMGRKQEMPNFQITERDPNGHTIPAGERETYFPVFYVAPLKGNEKAVGFDLGSDPIRRTALEQARDTGEPTVAERIRLVQETGEQFGFLIFLPVYRKGMPTDTVEQRRAAIEGFSLGVFRAGNVLRAVLGSTEPLGLPFDLLDLSAPVEQRILHHWSARLDAGDPGKSRFLPITSRYLRKFGFAGRDWGVEITASPAYVDCHYSFAYWVILPAGFLLTLILSFYLRAIFGQRVRLERTVFERTAQLREIGARTSHLNDVLRAIRDVGSLINRENDPIELLNAVCHSLVQTRGYVVVWIGKPEEDSKRVLMVARSGGGGDFLQHVPITWDDSPTGQGPAGTAIRERRVVVFDDLATDPRFAPWRDPVMSYGGASIVSVPVIHQERLFGVLTVKADRPHAFDVEEVELLSNLAAELARALQSLENEAARKQAEEALQDSETRYRLLADNATDVIWTTGMDMQLTYVSPSVTRLLDFTVEEAMARKMRQAYAPASREKAMRVFAEEMAIESAGNADPTRSLMLELELVRKDGNTVSVEANFCFLRDPTGKAIGVLAIARDITERNNAAKALHESELRLRTILQTANEGFWLVDNDTVTTDLNLRMCAILGRDREEVFGRKIFDFVDSENKAIFEHQIRLRAQGEVGAYEIALSRPDGSNVLCQFNATPLFDESGNKIGSFAMVTDISARKRAESGSPGEFRWPIRYLRAQAGRNCVAHERGTFLEILSLHSHRHQYQPLDRRPIRRRQ